MAARAGAGQASQDLPTITHFEQAAGAVSEQVVAGRYVCGPDPDAHVAAVREYVDAGYAEVHVLQIGPRQREMMEFYAQQVIPALN